MDYEKKYKEALELARVAAFNGHQSLMEGIFPELAESEDEKIRKELITHCRNTRCVTEERAERIAKWIAWLEKQGEQKPAWNEVDERILKGIIGFISHSQHYGVSNSEMLNWLKSLKQRIGG